MSLLSPSSQSTEVGSKLVVYLENHMRLVMRYYYTIIPLLSFLLNKHTVLISNKILGSFYDSNEFMTGLIELNHCLYKKARDHFVSHMEKRCRNIDDETHVKTLCFDGREILYLETDKKTRHCLFHIATTFSSEGKLREALFHSLTLKEILERTDDRRSDELIADNLNQLASYYRILGDQDTALELLTKAYHKRIRMHGGEGHIEIARSLSFIGLVYSNTGKPDEALRYHKEALEILKKFYVGADHPVVLDTLLGMGTALARMGEIEHSLEWHLQALDMAKILHGNGDHPVVLACLNNAAIVYSALGDLKTALMYHRQSLDMNRRLLNGQDHNDTAEVLSNIGEVYSKNGDFERALTYLTESLGMFKRILTSCYSVDDHLRIAVLLMNIGRVHKERGDNRTALLTFKEALAMMNRCMKGADHRHIAPAYFIIGEMLNVMDERLEEALENHKESLFMKKRLRTNDSDIAMSLQKVAELCMNTGRFDEAFIYNQDFLKTKKGLIGSRDDEDIASCLRCLGIIYRCFQHYDKAIESHLEALNMRKRLFHGKDHPKIVVSLHDIYITYTEAGMAESGANYRQECQEMEQRLDKGSGQATD